MAPFPALPSPTMSDPALTALSPLDGRYAAKAEALRPIFSEYGLVKARVHVEVEWLLALAAEPGVAELKPFSEAAAGRLRALRSPRAQELMDQVLPALLAALAPQGQPDAAFARWDNFLARLPAGTANITARVGADTRDLDSRVRRAGLAFPDSGGAMSRWRQQNPEMVAVRWCGVQFVNAGTHHVCSWTTSHSGGH